MASENAACPTGFQLPLDDACRVAWSMARFKHGPSAHLLVGRKRAAGPRRSAPPRDSPRGRCVDPAASISLRRARPPPATGPPGPGDGDQMGTRAGLQEALRVQEGHPRHALVRVGRPHGEEHPGLRLDRLRHAHLLAQPLPWVVVRCDANPDFVIGMIHRHHWPAALDPERHAVHHFMRRDMQRDDVDTLAGPLPQTPGRACKTARPIHASYN